jgi:hypothetical protein
VIDDIEVLQSENTYGEYPLGIGVAVGVGVGATVDIIITFYTINIKEYKKCN